MQRNLTTEDTEEHRGTQRNKEHKDKPVQLIECVKTYGRFIRFSVPSVPSVVNQTAVGNDVSKRMNELDRIPFAFVNHLS